MSLHDLLAGIVIIIGLVGILLVITPGLTIVVGAVVVWALIESSVAGWWAMSMAIAVGVATTALKYLYPGRKLKEAGIPTTDLLKALALGIISMFLIPVVGFFVGFVGGIYLFELDRVGREKAWGSTVTALKVILLSVGIELIGGFIIAVFWLAAVIVG